MIKPIIKKLLGFFDLEIKRKPKTSSFSLKISTEANKDNDNSIKEKIASKPLESSLHLDLAIKSFQNKNYFLALAELKSAGYLGLDNESFEKYLPEFLNSVPDLLSLNHNQFFRYQSLSRAIIKQADTIKDKNVSVLDVGGGNGDLSAFLPNMQYCLADPMTNGINGLKLPFNDESFDFVVSCHVFEHIPLQRREAFLDQLLAKSEKGVFLLNPIYIPETLPEERMKLFIEITNAEWAKEHLECTLPTIESVRKYANSRKLGFTYSPNGTVTTSMAFVFLQYYSSMVSNKESYQKINRFFNSKYFEILDSTSVPNAGLFFLDKRG